MIASLHQQSSVIVSLVSGPLQTKDKGTEMIRKYLLPPSKAQSADPHITASGWSGSSIAQGEQAIGFHKDDKDDEDGEEDWNIQLRRPRLGFGVRPLQQASLSHCTTSLKQSTATQGHLRGYQCGAA